MTKRDELNAALLNLGKGMNRILQGAMDNGNGVEVEIVMDVMNGNTTEGYAQSRFANTFAYSFDDEVSAFDDFLYAFTGKGYEVGGHEWENINNVLVGFEYSIESLERIVQIVNEDDELKRTLQGFTFDDEEGLAIRNLFAETTPYQFSINFKGWARAFKKEMRDLMGRNKYEKHVRTIKTAQQKTK